MELTKELKEKLENAESMEQEKMLKEAETELYDAELDQVAGGQGHNKLLETRKR